MSGRIDFSLDFKAQSSGQRQLDPERGLRLYVLGQFSGHDNSAWSQRKIRKIDLDNFDAILAQIQPTLELGNGNRLSFSAIEDFHPDHWISKLPLLADLRALKSQLCNPGTSAQAAAKIQGLFPSITSPEAPKTDTENQDDLIERLLGKKPESQPSIASSLDQYLSSLVSPHITQAPDPNHETLQQIVDATLSQFISAVLHHPDFQALEALWRATEALVNEENADAQSIYLVDISQTELTAVAQQADGALIERLLQHMQTSDDDPNVLLLSDYCFTQQHRALLHYCGQAATQLGGCLIGALDDELVSSAVARDPAQQAIWQSLIDGLATERMLLTYPRYLLRLPYGSKRDALESVVYEECSTIPGNEQLLWGNASFLCARALIRGASGQVFFGDTPAFSYVVDGEQKLQPATEAVLNEAQANALLAQGILPVVSYRQRQGVSLLAIDTVA